MLGGGPETSGMIRCLLMNSSTIRVRAINVSWYDNPHLRRILTAITPGKLTGLARGRDDLG